MKKLLKFAAPILILALLLASCDDRGSAPSGSELTVEIVLPTMDNYPTSPSMWSATMTPSAKGASEYQVKSIKYTAATSSSSLLEPAKPAMLTLSGIPAMAYDNTITVSYQGMNNSYSPAVPLGRTFQGTATIGSIAFGQTAIETSIGTFSDVTPQSVSVSLTGPAPSESSKTPLALPSDAKSYTVTLQPQSGKAIAISSFQVKDVKVGTAWESSSKQGSASTATIAFSADGIENGQYTLNIAFTANGATYAGSAAEVSIAAGGAALAPQVANVAAVSYGSILVTLPGTISSKALKTAVATNANGVALSYTVADQYGNVVIEPTATGALTAATENFTFSTSKTIPAAQSAATYTVSVTATYNDMDYVISLATANGPQISGSDVTNGAADMSSVQFEAQIAALNVKFATEGAPSSYPAYGTAYNVKYAEVNESTTTDNVSFTSFAITDAVAAKMGTDGFTIENLPIGKTYIVIAEFSVDGKGYSAFGTSSEKTVSIDSSSATTANAIELKFEGADAGDPEPEQVTATFQDAYIKDSAVTASGSSSVTQYSSITSATITGVAIDGGSGAQGETLACTFTQGQGFKFTGSIKGTEDQLGQVTKLNLTGVTINGNVTGTGTATVSISGTEITVSKIEFTLSDGD